jgi:molecular chaperone GrpE (heat shock protein)
MTEDYFEKMKQKSKLETKNISIPETEVITSPPPTPRPLSRKAAKEQAAKEKEKLEESQQLSSPLPAPQRDTKLQKLEKELKKLKNDFSELKNDFSNISQTTTNSNPNRKLNYEQFKEHMINNRSVGNHYNTYVAQYLGETTGHGKPKESNFKHIFMIYLDLP